MSGELITINDNSCLGIRQEDGTEIGLVWSMGWMNWDGTGIEVPGFPARYVIVGEWIEVTGDWFGGGSGSAEPLTEPCPSELRVWVADIVDGGYTD